MLPATQDLPLSVKLTSILGLGYLSIKYLNSRNPALDAIPTIGYSGFLTSYITAIQQQIDASKLVQEGYNKYPNRAFKMATLSGWRVIISGKQLVDDLRKAPEEHFSFFEAAKELTQAEYTLGKNVTEDTYHVPVIATPLTRNIGARLGDVRDEIVQAFNEFIPPSKDWVAVPAYETNLHLVCRSVHRFLVGLPLCRDPDYILLNETFTTDAVMGALIISQFPIFLRPLVGKYLTKVPAGIRRATKHLGPVIEDRLAKEAQYGRNWPDKPNDLISWLLELAKEHQRNVHDIVSRILTVNFAAVHSTSMSFTHALYDLAIYPEYVDEMRKEAEVLIAEYGWSKVAVQKMKKIDSFLKESLRTNFTLVSLRRRVLKDTMLSDGTLVPAGVDIVVANRAMNLSDELYSDASTFKGFRFAEMRDADDEYDGIKHHLVSIDMSQTFGQGRHTCPGRFFAVNELKLMFAHVLLTYDVQLEHGSKERPPPLCISTLTIPNTTAKVMFRKRST